jgi:DNA (cytosine-5)-methyltransferase 1
LKKVSIFRKAENFLILNGFGYPNGLHFLLKSYGGGECTSILKFLSQKPEIARRSWIKNVLDCQEEMNTISNMTIISKKAIDLFCGCGGISAGLQMAGYEVVAGVDIEKNFISTFSHNFPDAKRITQDITKISPQEFSRIIGIEPEELDLIAGGPPCQGFSKNVPRKHRYLDDPKNLLVKSFLDYVEYLLPKMVLMENVAEMKNGFDGQYTDEIISRLDDAGYEVTHSVLNSADYGVPQRRRRAFFMANRKGLKFKVPEPTHSQTSRISLFDNKPQHISVWDAIGDLPSLKNGEGYELVEYTCAPFSEYQRRIRNSNGIVKNHISRKLKDTQYQRLLSLEPGQGHKDLPLHLQVKAGYSGAYGRLTKEMIAPTITRWVFHPGSGRWGHPLDIRVISIREVARIQGFPDSFEFIGTYTQQCGQLGNAVPPLLAYEVINNLEDQLFEAQILSKRSSKRSNDIFSSAAGKLKSTA